MIFSDNYGTVEVAILPRNTNFNFTIKESSKFWYGSILSRIGGLIGRQEALSINCLIIALVYIDRSFI
jgi:hypothetical protein